MPIYSYCTKKKLVYITIVTPFSCQPSSCFKYIKLNIYSSCNVRLVFKYHAYLVALILLFGVIIPIYSYCTKKKLVYIIIAALSSHQPSSYSKCIKSNIYSFYNVRLVSNTKYIFFIYL